MFGRGQGGHGFSELLRNTRRTGAGAVNLPNNHVSTPGGRPEAGGSKGERRPNDKATQRHMDAKDNAGHQPGGARISHGSRKPWTDKPNVRINEEKPNRSPREINTYPTKKERAGTVPAPHLIGANRTKFSKSTTSKKLGSSGMSATVKSRPGLPEHQSVINRGPKGGGGRKVSFGRRAKLARSISY